jgi:hypothetical protein
MPFMMTSKIVFGSIYVEMVPENPASQPTAAKVVENLS